MMIGEKAVTVSRTRLRVFEKQPNQPKMLKPCEVCLFQKKDKASEVAFLNAFWVQEEAEKQNFTNLYDARHEI